jgi:hypothetical protein
VSPVPQGCRELKALRVSKVLLEKRVPLGRKARRVLLVPPGLKEMLDLLGLPVHRARRVLLVPPGLREMRVLLGLPGRKARRVLPVPLELRVSKVLLVLRAV